MLDYLAWHSEIQINGEEIKQWFFNRFGWADRKIMPNEDIVHIFILLTDPKDVYFNEDDMDESNNIT